MPPLATKASFLCPSCLKTLTPPYRPPTAPNCPSCGAKMSAGNGTPPVRVYCPRCHYVADAGSSDRCPRCDGPWYGFTSFTSPAQVPEQAFKHGVRMHTGPTANNLGPQAK
jgi:hypothetical protein